MQSVKTMAEEKNRSAMRTWGLMLYASMLLFLCQYLGVQLLQVRR